MAKIYVFQSDEQPILLAAGKEVQLKGIYTEAEWAELARLRPLATIGKLAVAEAQIREIWTRYEAATPDLASVQKELARAIATYLQVADDATSV